VLLAGAIYAGYRAVEWPGFALDHVTLAGERVTPRAAILHAAALREHGNIWLQNLGAAASRIEALPYIRTARLHRIPPNTIAIGVIERTADGCLIGSDEAAALIDADDRVLAGGCGTANLPRYRVANLAIGAPGTFVHDAGLTRLQSDAHALSGDGRAYASFVHDRFGDVDAVLPNGIVVEFGAEGDIQEKARLVEPILRQVGERSGTIAAIDLRAARTPVVRYRSANPEQAPH